MAVDPQAWARSAALSALGKLENDPHLLVKAAADALQVASTSFGALGRSMALIQKHGANDKAAIPGLVFALEHPGEGEGSQGLKAVMEMLIALDPDGKTAVPTLTKVAAGGYAFDRLRGNPRLSAIELLGRMGGQASGAVPVLKTIAAGTDEKQKALTDAAQAALKQIGQPGMESAR
jgi:hypothetical protein